MENSFHKIRIIIKKMMTGTSHGKKHKTAEMTSAFRAISLNSKAKKMRCMYGGWRLLGLEFH